MDESDQHEVLNLDHSISEARKDYVRARDHLRRILDDHEAGDGADRLLLEAAEEFGVEDAMVRFSKTPDAFGSASAKFTPSATALLAQTLEAVMAADFDLTRFVACRENILCAEDPARLRRYVFDGREALMDLDGKVIRFEENNSKAPLEIEGVEPSQPTDRDRLAAEREEFEASAKDRRRDRER